MMPYLALTILGILLGLWFLAPFFTKRILNIGNLLGIIISLCILIYGLFHTEVHHIATMLWNHAGWTRGLCIVLLLFLTLGVGIFLCNSIRIVLALGRRPNQPCTVIILGCKVYGTKASLMLTERLDAAASYLKEHPEADCIVSGGKGADEDISEAACMYRYLLEHAVPIHRIYLEDTSTTTRENLLFSSEIIKRQRLDSHLAIVSNEFHIYRAMSIARKLGFDAYCLPAKTAWWLFPTYFVREVLAIVSEDLQRLR